jgi:hypothetical protein
MAKVMCKRTDCTFISKSGFCQREYVFMTPQGLCTEWYSDQGVPYREQMSEFIRKFEAYDNTNNTESDMVNAENNTADNIDGSDNGGDKTAVEEIKETEEEVNGN